MADVFVGTGNSPYDDDDDAILSRSWSIGSSNEGPTFDATFEPSFMKIRPQLMLRTEEEESDDELLLLDHEGGGSELLTGSGSSTGTMPSIPNGTELQPAGRPFHCHGKRAPNSNHTARNQLIVISILCVLFMTGEIVGGVLSNSLALITDATHLASDLAGFLISLFAIYWGKKPATKNMTFGFYRAEVIGAIVSVVLIWVVTGILVYLAVQRVIHHNYHIHADEMLITAGCGVAFNIIMGVVLHSEMCGCGHIKTFSHGHSHGHGEHGHSHGAGGHVGNHSNPFTAESGTSAVVRQPPKKNINIRAAFIHVIGDLIQSIGVLIAAYIIKYKPEYGVADPICTFVFSILVLFTTLTVMRDAVKIVMEATPKDVEYDTIKDELHLIPGVRAVHNLHIWTLTLETNAASVHLATEPDIDTKKILRVATRLLQGKFKMHTTTVQVEDFAPDIISKCSECTGPIK